MADTAELVDRTVILVVEQPGMADIEVNCATADRAESYWKAKYADYPAIIRAQDRKPICFLNPGGQNHE